MPASDAIWLYEIQICSSVSERSLRPSIFLRLLRPSEIIWSESQPARPSIFAIAFDDMRRCLHFLVEAEVVHLGDERLHHRDRAEAHLLRLGGDDTVDLNVLRIASLHDVIA